PHIDLAGAADRERVLGNNRYASPNGVVERALAVGRDHVVAACVPVDVERPLRPPVVDGGHAHAGNAVHDLVGQALPHEASADHTHANGQTLLLASLESLVYDDHDVLLPCLKRSS